MQKGNNRWLLLLGGVLIGAGLVYFFSFSNRSTKDESTQIMAYEISRLNKMITADRTYSKVYRFENKRSLPYLSDYFSFDKKLVLLVNARAQVVYDLSQLDIELDSVNKIINLKYIPEPEKQIIPEVRFFDMEQSTFNTFKDNELNEYRDKAVDNISEEIDADLNLKNQARNQLYDNLKQLFLSAKTYGWTVRNQSDEDLDSLLVY